MTAAEVEVQELSVSEFEMTADLSASGVLDRDPGYVYCIRDQNRLKIGKSQIPSKRFQDAKTWLPDAILWSPKPFWNHSIIENELHIGFQMFWKVKEWFDFECDPDYLDRLQEEFAEFSNEDINYNSSIFVRWINGSGCSEALTEYFSSNISKAAFLRGEG